MVRSLALSLVAAGLVAAAGCTAIVGPGFVAPPPGPATAITGLFRYMADAARITLCADGRSLPVAMEGDYLALESAYLAARGLPGQALWVQVQGRVTPRPSAEWGRPPEPTLVVDRFEQVRPGQACGQPAVDVPLRGTVWRLVGLAGGPVRLAEREGAPQLTISADGTQVSGHGGCNRMSGPVEIRGDRISFGRLASTRMACATAEQLESAFFDALARSAQWRIQGGQLELRDARGSVVARLVASVAG